MSIQKALNMEDCLRKLRLVSETLEEYGDPESESLSMLIDDCIDYLDDFKTLPTEYGDLIDRDKLLEWQNITCVDTGMWQTDFDAVKTSVIKDAPVVVKGNLERVK